MDRSLPSARVVAAPPPADSSALVHGARAGDSSALGALYDRYAEMLYRTAYRLSANSADAQDAVHDCFVGLPEALRQYDERGALDAWLRRIIVRLVLMRQRSESRRRESSIEIETLPASDTRADAGTEMSEVRRAVDALPAPLRDVFILKQVEGYAHDEIARFMGITAGASRVRLARALESLRRTLTPSR